MNGSADRFFLDNNLLVYVVDPTDRRKQDIALVVIAEAHQGNGCLSYQVVQEWFNVVLRKSASPLSLAEATRLYRMLLEPLWRIHSSRELMDAALDIHKTSKVSWWDALIVSAALQGGCGRLLSEDLQHGAAIQGVRIENPFRKRS